MSRSSEKGYSFTHGGLDVNGLEVVPSLLEHGDQEVEGHHDVLLEFFIIEFGIENGTAGLSCSHDVRNLA